ncbi:putative electron transfer flavoprotein FixA [Escherichia albertii]|uniref:putative electron transfer flavoprotein FixA n=1 Tax=Escherichia albertii TaxID=208962 RepID=UPI0006A1DA2F|nr:putative electron transfer flavoprotein FixA [Escherichia albertii]CTU66251.1 putative electron transfer flavoprotein beta subunit [Escherichia coli]EFF0797079.1 putative electron transfer flavoprotein FixA [Escherichia albertii]EHG7530039.1 putative electron transfer flavoprotein FixA [Escherichia albertii]EJM0806506.1 putative electron transfer flavoprotein FixA [Escherichia albertii]EJM1765999.1 putative electron transfer flavoprotein FixA [Escherichia albertii]
MKLITCCKVVRDELDIIVEAHQGINTDNAGLKISLYDLNALEAAVEIAQNQPDSHVTALSLGSQSMLENSKIRKDILSRGVDALTVITGEEYEALYPTESAILLAAAAKKIGFDLLICGEGSGDLYAQQTGIQIGERLNLPCINAVSKITVSDSCVIVERTLEDAVEELELSLPAVISVSSDINVPKLPSMKAILSANKKPIIQWGADDLATDVLQPTATRISVSAPEQKNRLGVIVEGDSDESINIFADYLRQALNH